jgi:WD40 repeat protein
LEVPGHEILEEIGRGGMGVVYKARQVALGRVVAVKMIHLGVGENRDMLARFHAEATAIARLKHPNIIQVHEVGSCAAGPYLVMELAEGGNLAARLDGAPQPARAAAALVRTVAGAVHFAHEQGVVHRDLKPANILIAEQGDAPLEKCTPKISDFGLARQLDGAHSLTLSGQVMGTPGYLPPEQARGARDVGPSADVYSLGVLLYEAITGREPFCGSTALETVHLMLIHEPVPPSRFRPELPRDLETVVLKCLQKEPHRRYASARDLADDLERFLDGKPVVARPVPAWVRLWKWARRQPGTAALAGCVVVLVIVGFLLVTWQWLRAEAAGEAHRRERDRALHLAAAEVEAHRKAQRLSARLLLEHGVTLCEKGDPAAGLLWLTRALKATPRGDVALERSVRLLLGGWQQVHPLHYYRRHPNDVRLVACSGDGAVLATATKHSVYLWETTTGKPRGEAVEMPGKVLNLCPTPGGLAALVRVGLTVEVRSLPDKALLGPPIACSAQPRSAALRGDGKVVVVGDEQVARPCWVATGMPETQPWKHGGAVRVVAFSRDGRWAVTGSDDKLARVWHVTSGKLVRVLKGHTLAVVAAAFSPDGRQVLTGGLDHRAFLWDASSGKPLHRLRHSQGVQGVAFHPTGRVLATGSDDSTTRVWETATGRPVGAPVQHPGEVTGVAFTPDGRFLASTADDGTLRVHGVREGGAEIVLPHSSPVLSLAVSPDGKRLLSGTSDGTVRLWNLTAQTARIVATHTTAPALAFNPAGDTFLVGDVKGTARLYDAATLAPRGVVMEHGEAVLSAAFSPDGRLIATGCNDENRSARPHNIREGNFVRLWDARTGKVVRRLVGPQRKVPSLAFSRDGALLLTGSWDLNVMLWDVTTGSQLPARMRHLELVQSVAFSPDGALALSGADDCTARLWDVPTGREHGMPLRHADKVQAVAFSPRGDVVATGTKGHDVRLWDVASGKQVGPAMQHLWEVRALAFAPGGGALYSASWDATVRRWQVPQARQGDPEEVRGWLEAHTGLRLDPSGAVAPLKLEEWEAVVGERR